MKRIFTFTTMVFFACSSQQSSQVLDEGSMGVVPALFEKIKLSCDSMNRINRAGVTYSPEECYLLLAGVTNKESSWDENKGCNYDYGSPPVCGLTQSRSTDTSALGLSCDVTESLCNLKTGWLNIISHGNNFSEGVDKHLGDNTGAKPSYVAAMRLVYERGDVRRAFGITSDNLQPFDAVFYGSAAKSVRRGIVQDANSAIGGCDYKDAAQHNGWGWNETTRESCPPRTAAAGIQTSQPQNSLPSNGGFCDYKDAAQHNGWGWNDVTKQSCPPRS